MKIDKTFLLDEAKVCLSPNSSERKYNEISLLVIHNISLPPGKYGGDYIEKFFTNQLNSDDDPYFKDIIDSEYILDIILGISIFVIIIFLVLLISKGISRTVKYSGLGKLDTLFGFLFGFVRSYIICVCLFSAVDIVYNSKKWPVDAKKSFTFSYVEKGSNYLIKEFPNEKNYEDAKDKVQEL